MSFSCEATVDAGASSTMASMSIVEMSGTLEPSTTIAAPRNEGTPSSNPLRVPPVSTSQQQPSSDEQRIISLDNEDVFVSPAVETATKGSSFEMKPGNFFYVDGEVEEQFLQYEMERNSGRFLGFCILTSVFAFIYYATSDHTIYKRMVLVPAISGALTSIVEGFLIYRMKKAQPQEVRVDGADFAYAEGAQLSGSGKENVVKAAAAFTTSPVRRRLAVVHDILGIIFLAIVCGMISYVYTMAQTKCQFLYSYDDRRYDHDCHYRLYPLWFMFQLVPLITGQPRFIFLCFVYLEDYLILISFLTLHDTSVAGYALIYAICAVFVVFCALLRRIDETQHRKRFEAELTLATQTKQVWLQDAALKSFVVRITPKPLRRRLLSSSAKLHVDASHNAVCLVVNIHAVQEFVTSMLPVKAAAAIGRFNNRCVTLSTHEHVEHIRSVGDTNYFVCNLFCDPESSRSITDELLAPLRVLAFAAKLSAEAGPGLQMGISNGYLCGLPVGSSCIRYDIFGPALDDAQALALSCPARRVQVTPNFFNTTKDYAVFQVPSQEGQTASDTAAKAATTTAGQSRLLSMMLPHAQEVLSGAIPPSYIHTPQVELSEPVSMASASDSPGISSTMGYSNITQLSAGSGMSWGDLSPEKITTAEIVIPTTRRNLEQVSRWCFLDRFVDNETEEDAARHHRVHHHRSFLLCCGFFLLLSILLLTASVEERWGCLDVGMYLFIATSCMSMLVFGLLIVMTLWNGKHGDRCIRLFFTTCLFALVGVNTSRPSVAGDDSDFLFFSISMCALFVGARLEEVLVFEFLLIVLDYCMLLHRPIVTNLTIFNPGFWLLTVNTAVLRWKMHRKLFCDLVRSSEALAEVHAHTQIREAVHDALVPSQLRGRVTSDSIKLETLATINGDECVVIHLRITLDNTIMASFTPEQLHDYVEQATTVVEAAVAICPSLDIVKVFGGTFVIAGPLEEPALTPFTIVDAASDTLQFFAALFQNEELPPFTAGVASEQSVSVLRLTEYPSHDLIGLAVNTSRALFEACPGPMVVVTEHLANLFEREKLLQAQCGVLMAPAERWRVRGVGGMRIRRLITSASER